MEEGLQVSSLFIILSKAGLSSLHSGGWAVEVIGHEAEEEHAHMYLMGVISFIFLAFNLLSDCGHQSVFSHW